MRSPRTPNEFSDCGNLSSSVLSAMVHKATGMYSLSYARENAKVVMLVNHNENT
jgi:hypothetical protein